MEYLVLVLSVIAIMLSMLALLPYILELCFRWRWKPKFKVTIDKIKVKQADTNPPIAEVNFDLSWACTGGKPFFLDGFVLILPASAEPSPSAWGHPKGSELQWGMYIERGEWPPPVAITLESNQTESWYSDIVSVYHVGFKIPNPADVVPLILRWRVEIDAAKLGVWSIFCHARNYVLFKDFKVHLTHSGPQDFE